MISNSNSHPGFALGALPLVLLLAGGCHYRAGDFSWFGGDLPSTARRTGREGIAPEAKSIEVENRFGEVRVVAVDLETPGWTWHAQAWAKTEALAEAAAAEMKVEVETNGESLRINVIFPDEISNRRFRSDLEIHAPKSCAIRALNAFGPMTIIGVDGPVEAHGRLGSIEVRGVRGGVEAQTSFAGLKIADCGPARLKDQNGAIDATNIRGPLEVETSFARLSARDIEGCRYRNQNGAVVERVETRDLDVLCGNDSDGPWRSAQCLQSEWVGDGDAGGRGHGNQNFLRPPDGRGRKG